LKMKKQLPLRQGEKVFCSLFDYLLLNESSALIVHINLISLQQQYLCQL